MKFLALLVFLIVATYSIIGGIILLMSYIDGSVVGQNKKDKDKNFRNKNREFFKKLIKYSTILLISFLFFNHVFKYYGVDTFDEYFLAILAVPAFLWANTLIIGISLLISFINKKE